MANVPKIHELKIEDEILKCSINSVVQAMSMLEVLRSDDQSKLTNILAGLTELLSHLTPHLEE
jgi:hypothetical protein